MRSLLAYLGSLAWLGAACARQALRLGRAPLAVVVGAARNQVRFTALEAFPLVVLTALLVGGVTLLQVLGSLEGLVPEAYVTRLVTLLLVRELGPLLVAVVVVGRSGTAIAAEMATLKLGKQADTLAAIGVDPISYLLLPRLLGGVVSLFTLIVLFDAVALLGGFAVASWRIPFSFRLYLGALGEAIGPSELAVTLAKALAFGCAVPLVTAHAGLGLKASATEIPQAVTRGAMNAIAAVFLLSAAISLVFRA